VRDLLKARSPFGAINCQQIGDHLPSYGQSRSVSITVALGDLAEFTVGPKAARQTLNVVSFVERSRKLTFT
jgi:hypothetical protein